MIFRKILFCASLLLLVSCSIKPDIWRPYPTVSDADQTKTGWETGDRIPDILLLSDNGSKKTISDFKGDVVFLHFWASWCRPCKNEIPIIQKLYNKVNHEEVSFVLANLWEPYATGKEWMKKNDYTLPIYNSKSSERKGDNFITLSDGKKTAFTKKTIPKTFIIDRNGIIIFKQNGSKNNWLSYEEAFQDIVKFSAPEKN
jgi:thiol-disulfide isomerase/thioredoxin